MAQLSIIGNLGRDPEMSYTPDGTATVKFSVAVTRKTKDKESTTWFNCVAFRKQAETINPYVKKGQQSQPGRSLRYGPQWGRFESG